MATHDPHQITDAGKALAFVLAGNSYFTIRSAKTGTRYTYRVSLAKPNPKYPKSTTFFVSVMTGSDNTSDYSYVGILANGTQFRTTSKSRLAANDPRVTAFVWLHAQLSKLSLPPVVEFWHEGRCGRCARKLTVPESIEAGIGPECAGKIGFTPEFVEPVAAVQPFIAEQLTQVQVSGRKFRD